MPENGEVRNMARQLNGMAGRIIESVILVEKEGRKTPNKEEIEKIQTKLPLQIEQAKSRGKELAILCSDNLAITFHLGGGGFIVIEPKSMLRSKALLQHANLVFILNDDFCIVACETLQAANQITVALQPSSFWWDVRRSPDILDDSDAFLENLQHYLQEDPEYFQTASLFDVFRNQSLFNGLGSYSSNEILHLIYENLSWNVLSTELGRNTIIKLIQAYFREMELFLGSQPASFSYNQSKEMNFERIFVRVHRRNHAVLKTVDEKDNSLLRTHIPVQIYKVSSVQSKKFMYVLCETSSLCYSIAPPSVVTVNKMWTHKKIAPTSTESNVKLHVGPFSWYSGAAIKLLLDCPFAQVKMNLDTYQQVSKLQYPQQHVILNEQVLQRYIPAIQSINLPFNKNNTFTEDSSSNDSEPCNISKVLKKKTRKNKVCRTMYYLAKNMAEICFDYKLILEQKK